MDLTRMGKEKNIVNTFTQSLLLGPQRLHGMKRKEEKNNENKGCKYRGRCEERVRRGGRGEGGGIRIRMGVDMD
jgi:hypothetical protein